MLASTIFIYFFAQYKQTRATDYDRVLAREKNKGGGLCDKGPRLA